MRSRLLSIKKSTWLISSLILNLSLFAIFTVISFVVIKDYNAWFYVFCFNIGAHLISKSFLFKLDSSCYFGVVLLFIGLFYFVCKYMNLQYFYLVFVIASFAIASLLTYIFYRQPYHLFLSLSLIFVMIGLLLLLINLISIWIFVAIIVGSVLLLILKFCLLK